MILRDGKGYYAFGLTDEQPPAETMLIYARTQEQCITILAHRKGCHVHILEATSADSAPALSV